jgi:signal transduction histidine kinase
MPATASWIRRHWLESLWVAFAILNLLAILEVPNFETVPFHFIWVSFTILYGFRVWKTRTTFGILSLVCVATALTLGWAVVGGPQGADELTEVPLMGAMFLAMVWHAERRQSALHEAKRAASREREFIRDASHQLKTPIAVARGYAQLARSTAISESTRDDLEALVHELDRLGSLSERLLLLATSEQDALRPDWVDFEELIVSTVRHWSNTAHRRWRVDARAYGFVFADGQRLREALDALMENAVRATEPGDVIALAGLAEGDAAVIELVDEGSGIAPDGLHRVTDRFYSDWPNRNGNGNGRSTGLGLAIVQAIVAAHDGDLEIASEPGVGTTVTITLPSFSPAGEAGLTRSRPSTSSTGGRTSADGARPASGRSRMTVS